MQKKEYRIAGIIGGGSVWRSPHWLEYKQFMLANVLIESFVLTDIKLGDQERNRQIVKLKTSPI
jgi:hypothetical protein